MVAAVETMAYTGEVPWHGLGTSVADVMTAKEAIINAGLDWDVELTPVTMQVNSEHINIPHRRATRRTTDNQFLGMVSTGYKPIQNVSAFEFFDNLVDSSEAKYETAGSLSDGKRVWLTAKVGEDITINGDDPHGLYLLLLNSHDGTKALTAVTTMIRVVCQNTATLAIRGAKTSWTLNHRKDLDGRVIEARDALGISYKYQEAFEKEVQKLMSVSMTSDKFSQILADVLPEQKHAQDKKVDAMVGLFNDSVTIKGTSSEGNGYGAMNAVTEYISHHGRQTEEAKMIYNLLGQGVPLRNNVRDAILASA